MAVELVRLTYEQWNRLAAYFISFPLLEPIYRFKRKLCYLLLHKHRNQKQRRALLPRFLRATQELRDAKLTQLVQPGETLPAWSQKIVVMGRFTRNNGITEGFHDKWRHQPASLRLPQLRELQTQSQGVVWLTGLGFRGLPPLLA